MLLRPSPLVLVGFGGICYLFAAVMIMQSTLAEPPPLGGD